MYKCDKCGKNSEPKEKCNIVPIKFRKKAYPKHNTVGQEIVEEQKLCGECAGKHIKEGNNA